MFANGVRWENGVRVVEGQTNAEGVHLYPFDPAFPIDVRFFTLGRRNSVRMNRHDYFELCYVFAGRTNWQVQGRIFSVGEGDMVVMGSDLYHRPVDPPDAHSRLVFLFFEPEIIRAAHGTGEETEYLMPFLAQKSDFPHVIPAGTNIPSQALDLMRRIHAELPAITGSAKLAIRTYLQMILILLVKHYSAYTGTREDFQRRRADLDRLRPVFDYLEKHSHMPVQVNYAARLCAMSGSHFMSFFKKTTGESFHSYLNQFRIAKAQFLLATTDKPLDVISNEIGFCNQSYFGTIFRRLVGDTPLAYRRRMGKGCDIGHSPMSNHPSEAHSVEEVRERNFLSGRLVPIPQKTAKHAETDPF
jgi:AraC-like DNA-binding protein/mannose-6-phosphate isomerase-like protein (cupin superfamily)